jgi:hypothetical protein
MIKFFLFCLLGFVLLGCSAQILTNVAMSQRNDSSNNSNKLDGKKDKSPIKPIGTFMNVKTDGEHASGYLIRLWSQEEKVYGLVSVHQGLMGDPPAGILDNVEFDSKTNKLSFKAKLSLGLFLDKDKSYVPSKDTLEFVGSLKNKKLSGEILMTNELCSDKCPDRKKVTLPLSKEWTEGMEEYQTYGDWKGFADEILQRRGPNW